jgi:hypothetical protein
MRTRRTGDAQLWIFVLEQVSSLLVRHIAVDGWMDGCTFWTRCVSKRSIRFVTYIAQTRVKSSIAKKRNIYMPNLPHFSDTRMLFLIRTSLIERNMDGYLQGSDTIQSLVLFLANISTERHIWLSTYVCRVPISLSATPLYPLLPSTHSFLLPTPSFYTILPSTHSFYPRPHSIHYIKLVPQLVHVLVSYPIPFKSISHQSC